MSGVERIDDVLTAVGYSWWQMPVLASLIVVNVIPVHYIISTLVSAPMAFRCHYPSHVNASVYSVQGSKYEVTGNGSGVWFNNECLPPAPKITPSSASAGADVIPKVPLHHRATGLLSCPIIEYDTSVYTSTIISEFDLVCERAWMRPLFQIMVTIGAIIGCFVGGPLGDGFGRRKAMLVGALLGVPASVAIGFVPWLPLVLALRIFVGMSIRTCILASVNLVMETCPPRHRTLLGMFMGLPYSAACILFGLTGYFVRDWRYLHMIVSIPFLFLLPIALWVDESPRWLVQSGSGQEAVAILEKAAIKNRVELPLHLKALLTKIKEKGQAVVESEVESSKDEDVGCLVRWVRGVGQYVMSPAMLIIILVSPFVYCLMNILYNGMVLNVNNFTSTSPFLYIAMFSSLEIVSILGATPVTQRIGRRASVCIALLIGGVLFMLDPTVPEDLWYVRWILIMAACFLVGGGYQINMMYAPELFPTVIRNKGFAFVTLMGSLGQIAAPIIIEFLTTLSWWAVSVTLGGAGVLAGLMVPLLPETNNRPLPENIKDVEDRRNNVNAYSKEAADPETNKEIVLV